MVSLKFKVGDYALLQGQVVEIIEILPIMSKHWPEEFGCRVKLLNDTLTHKVPSSKLATLNNQDAPKILYSTPKRKPSPKP
jgi:hypothetical protein